MSARQKITRAELERKAREAAADNGTTYQQEYNTLFSIVGSALYSGPSSDSSDCTTSSPDSSYSSDSGSCGSADS